MTGGQMGAALAPGAFAFVCYLKFMRPMMNQREGDVDEFDVSVSKFKHRRRERGLCVYRGSPTSNGEPAASLRAAVCRPCAAEMNPG